MRSSALGYFNVVTHPETKSKLGVIFPPFITGIGSGVNSEGCLEVPFAREERDMSGLNLCSVVRSLTFVREGNSW